MGIVIGCVYVQLFFNSTEYYILVVPFLLVYRKRRKERREEERREKLAAEFKDALQSMNAMVYVGYSMEHAILQVAKELQLLYGKKSVLYPEFVKMSRQISVGQTVENCFIELGERVQIEEIKLFAQVFAAAKRTGGDMHKVIRSTWEKIEEGLEWKRQVNMLVGEKKTEKKVMNFIPLFLIFYMRITSPQVMGMMYQGTRRIVMGVCLAAYIGFYIAGEKIIENALKWKEK